MDPSRRVDGRTELPDVAGDCQMERHGDLELLLLGTGTSSQVPAISCLTAPPGQGCSTCLSTLTPEGSKNIRRNTSALIRVWKGVQNGERPKTILIDTGKSFCEAARELFPRNGVRELDAVFLTHPHADAINGLDDLRAWTLGGVIQKSVSVYCNASTKAEVQRMFPYMISAAAVTGGGDVPAFQWHVIDDEEPFELFGVRITPLPVHHGTTFGATPGPYFSLAFLFDQSLCYMADVSEIPETTWQLYEKAMARKDDVGDTLADAHLVANGKVARGQKSLPFVIIDCLRIHMHWSHFGAQQAVTVAHRMRAQRSYMVGFAHRVSHDTWIHFGEAVGRGDRPKALLPPSYKPARHGATSRSEHSYSKDDAGAFTDEALQEVYAYEPDFSGRPWIRPGFDGLRVFTDGRTAWDSGYAD